MVTLPFVSEKAVICHVKSSLKAKIKQLTKTRVEQQEISRWGQICSQDPVEKILSTNLHISDTFYSSLENLNQGFLV